MKRINRYLNADEIDENAISRDESIKEPIMIDAATFKWTRDDSPVLNDISIKVEKNKLAAVVGQVGSGKSYFKFPLIRWQ